MTDHFALQIQALQNDPFYIFYKQKNLIDQLNHCYGGRKQKQTN